MNIKEHSHHWEILFFQGFPTYQDMPDVAGTSSKQHSLNQAGQQTFSLRMTYQGKWLVIHWEGKMGEMVWTTQVLNLGSNIAQMAFITTGPSNYGTEKWFANDVPELVVGWQC